MKVFFEILKVEIFSRFIFEKYSHGNFNFFFMIDNLLLH